jgi:hypothetical protein
MIGPSHHKAHVRYCLDRTETLLIVARLDGSRNNMYGQRNDSEAFSKPYKALGKMNNGASSDTACS